MATVSLKRLDLSRFRAFAETQVLEFPKTGIGSIQGNGSGCGKSSIPLAIAEALGFCPVPASSLKTWGVKGTREVSLTLDVGGKDLVVKRSSGMSMEWDGNALEGAPAYLESTLANKLGLKDISLLGAMTYRPQRSRSFLLSMPDSEVKDFFGKVLGLEVLETEAAAAENNSKGFSEQVKKKEAAVAANNAARHSTNTALLALPAAEPDVDLTPLEAASALAHSARISAASALAQAQKRLEEARAEFQTPKTALVLPPEVDVALSHVDKTQAAIQREKQKFEAAKALRDEWAKARREWERAVHLAEKATEEAARIARLFAAHEEHLCDQCGQHWDASPDVAAELTHARDKAADQAQAAKMHAESLHPGEEPVAVLDTETVQRLEATAATLRSRIQIWTEQAQKKFAQGQQEELAPWLEKCARFEAEVATAHAEFSAAVIDVGARNAAIESARAANSRNASLGQSRQSGRENLAALEAQSTVLEAELAAAVEAQLVEDKIALLLGPKGFGAAILEEIFEEISREASDLFRRIPNIAHVTMSFSTTAGKRPRTVPVFRASGQEIVNGWDRIFSGGQVAAIELALDLAVASVIGRRCGVTPGWLVLDEPFYGLPMEEVEQVLQAIEVIAQTRLVLIVDHAPEVKERASFVVEVSMAPATRRSTIKVLDVQEKED